MKAPMYPSEISQEDKVNQNILFSLYKFVGGGFSSAMLKSGDMYLYPSSDTSEMESFHVNL